MMSSVVLALLGSAVAVVAAPPKKVAKPVAPKSLMTPVTTQTGFTDNTPLTEEQKIVHVLNRVGFGPRPGDVERVKAMGLSRYIDQQLHPEQISDSAVEFQLSEFPVLQASGQELAASYLDTLRTGVQLKQIQANITDRMKADGQDGMTPEQLAEQTPAERAANTRKLYANATPEEQAKLKDILQKRQKAGRRDSVQEAARALSVSKAVRAVESDRQLYEVMCDFWSNHFNIDMRKNQCRVLKVADERDVIRKYALGKFRDLLGASAHSPAMMVYLDNANNQMPLPDNPRRDRLQQQFLQRLAQDKNNPDSTLAATALNNKRGKGGVNENYAREIMELHTLGVDGGYTQKDVQEVARCFTGWGVGNQRLGNQGEFYFNARRHDNGEKVVLGTTIPAGGGASDGELVLDILASRPATMRFVSTKLCQRLVADEPPASLVDKCVATWKRTDGNIREIVRTIVTSPEFYSRVAYRQKIKSPFEYAVSSVRAVGGTIDLSSKAIQRGRKSPEQTTADLLLNALNRSLVRQVATMGQPLFQYSAAPGWPEDSRKWVSSGALVSRLNFALGLLRGEIVDVSLPPTAAGKAEDTATAVNVVTNRILNGDVSPATRATLLKQATEVPVGKSRAVNQPLEQRLTALALGSPEFQRR